MRSVVHHVDRARAVPGGRRVLVPGGRFVLDGIDPDRLRGTHASSFHLLADGECAEGPARSARERPDGVRYTLRSLVVVADAD